MPPFFSALLLAALGLVPPQAAADAVAFMYHRFGEDNVPSTSVRLAQFEAQLEFLEREGFEVWPLPRILDHLDSGRALPERTVAITIDDAYLSVYREAFPRLRRRGWPFTVFVATDPVDQGLAGYMDWEQLRELQRHGATIGNHSASHDYLIRRHVDEDAAAWLARVRADIERAARRIEQELGAPAQLFAYPFGEYDTALAELVTELGYTAFGQQSGAIGAHADRRALPRYPINEAYGVPEEFAAKARSLALPVASAEPWDPVWRGTEPPRLTLTLHPSAADLDRLACYASGQGRMELRWEDREARRFSVQAARPLGAGRHRYNCTAPVAEGGRYYWHSQLWIVAPPAGAR